LARYFYQAVQIIISAINCGSLILNTEFHHYYQQIRSKQKREALIWSGLMLVLYLWAGSISELNLKTIFVNAPHFFDYIGQTVPTLHWHDLFADGHTKGSLAYWGYRLNIQLPLIWETIQLAFSSTILSTVLAVVLAFIAANNTDSPKWLKFSVRTFVAFLRTMPELAWAVMCVMAFYESIETASDKPVRGLKACGAGRLQRMRFALWPQVQPIFLSYSFMRLEINFRQSTILGLVGAGGIGQELMTSIKLDRYDQVSMTLLLIIFVVSVMDYASGKLRKRVVEGTF
jgi:phosphonate transport system permease protein